METRDLIIDERFAHALDRMESGEAPLFVTGKAGTGKSTLLSHWRGRTKRRLAVLAPTGVAALNVEGVTIHSFFRFRPDVTVAALRDKGPDAELERILSKIDAIVIDEVSMVRADMMDCVDLRLRQALGRSDRAFGGMRMILIGDLFQLPPVSNREEDAWLAARYETPYFFSANAFKGTDPLEIVELDRVHRQSEEEFIDVLNAIRENRMEEIHREMLLDRVAATFVPGAEEDWITLTATNAQADQINGAYLARLGGEAKEFAARVDRSVEQREFPTTPLLTLKVGAQVMFVMNDVLGRWVNGTIGRVTGFTSNEVGDRTVQVRLRDGNEVTVEPHTWGVHRWRYDDGADQAVAEVVGTFKQFPLRLAWAVTIHKSQGKTFDRAIVDLGARDLFAAGQLYVALSRCRTFDGLVLRRGVRGGDVRVDRRIVDFLRRDGGERLKAFERELDKAIGDESPVAIEYDPYDPRDRQRGSKRFVAQEIGEVEMEGRTYACVHGLCLVTKTPRSYRLDGIASVRRVAFEAGDRVMREETQWAE